MQTEATDAPAVREIPLANIFFDAAGDYSKAVRITNELRTKIDEMKKKKATKPKAPEEPAKVEEKVPETYRVVVESILRSEAARRRSPETRSRMVLISNIAPTNSEGKPHSGLEFLGYSGWVSDIELARPMPLSQAITLVGDHYTINLMDDELLAKEPPKKRFDFKAFSDRHINSLVEKCPQNRVVHALLAARFKVSIPDSVEKTEEIINWIETRGTPPMSVATPTTTPANADMPLVGAQTLTLRVGRGFVETGMVRYHESGMENGEVPVPIPWLIRVLDISMSLGRAKDNIMALISTTMPENITRARNEDSVTYDPRQPEQVNEDGPFEPAVDVRQFLSHAIATNPALARFQRKFGVEPMFVESEPNPPVATVQADDGLEGIPDDDDDE